MSDLIERLRKWGEWTSGDFGNPALSGERSDGMQVIRVPGWGLGYGNACYWGRRHCAHIGPFLILWGQMTDAEIEAWDAARPTAPTSQEQEP